MIHNLEQINSLIDSLSNKQATENNDNLVVFTIVTQFPEQKANTLTENYVMRRITKTCFLFKTQRVNTTLRD